MRKQRLGIALIRKYSIPQSNARLPTFHVRACDDKLEYYTETQKLYHYLEVFGRWAFLYPKDNHSPEHHILKRQKTQHIIFHRSP